MLFLPKIISAQDTLICDNGGFESNFLYYKGYDALYNSGSDDCIPKYLGVNVNWGSPLSLPANRKFEIVNSGTDDLVGFTTTKFGSKGLKINNNYGHTTDTCSGNRDANRLIKRFKVTEDTRDFTVWYAAILENPSGHSNSQPFFSIKCDLASQYDLCFDASILQCEENYNDSICDFDQIDALDWSCHRFKISKEEIGNIATLEIITADCGCGAHFGYAYIDGICEDCFNSSLGSIHLFNDDMDSSGLGINYLSCDSDTILICGSYELPTICGDWDVDSITLNGITIDDIEIDEVNKIFCFKLPYSIFDYEECLEFYAEIYFDSPLVTLPPQLSNTIEICKDQFENFSFEVSECFDNGTIPNISDDYYYVTVDLNYIGTRSWSILRQLVDPYPDEDGTSTIESGVGSGTFILGPFLIQEGSWQLVIDLPECDYFDEVSPPEYCSSCEFFNNAFLSDVECIDPPGTQWEFKLFVPGPTSGTYSLSGDITDVGNYSVTETFGPYTISQNCLTFTLTDGEDICVEVGEMTVCPPKPCNVSCKIEVKVEEVICDEEEKGDFFVKLDITSGTSGYICYKIVSGGTPTTFTPFPGSGLIGPFSSDIILVIALCPTHVCGCTTPSCYKVLYIAQPDCESREEEPRKKIVELDQKNVQNELLVTPNPFNTNELILKSKLKWTIFELYNIEGKILLKDNFIGEDYKISINLNSGIYFIKYIDDEGNLKITNAIKQ